MVVDVDLTPDQVKNGVRKGVKYRRYEPCGHCHGSGSVSSDHAHVCPSCGGTGAMGVDMSFLFGGGEGYGGVLAGVAGVLQLFRADGVGPAQRLAPGQIVGFLAQIHPAHADGGLGFPELRLKAAGIAHRRGQRHKGTLIGKAGVHGIDAHEPLPGGDHVVVVHIHGDDLAAHLRHDTQHVAGDIGVVRAFLKTQEQIPPRASAYPRKQEQQKQEADERAPAGAFAPLLGLVVVWGHGEVFVCRHERLPCSAWFPDRPLFSQVGIK